ncbi:hypothetical protein [Cryobacterium sp. TMT4-10]|uniref:hypothetical protein n=1 Tax=Cryobacterium sp. TMT4-10 TaxID=1259256 RepID=UPI00106C7C77|nr:hypothetical protein [Cryobacterium sp. TMT4-10]TFD16789.1 hypothetical protein E3T42_08760 [Cryobacterium sp. TMT4-10]
MTRIPWERYSGEDVEEFVAALVLKRAGNGHLITPAQGDRGIDIRVPTQNGYEIWQVKRYTSALTSAQKKSVKKSWDSFVKEALPTIPVVAWKLAMPFNPTNEALEWFEKLTAGGVLAEWVGRSMLDIWAADEPGLTEYYFGNGRDETVRLMAQAITSGAEIPNGIAGEDLLAAVTNRAVQLQKSLDTVDPFYRYEIEVLHGEATDDVLERDTEAHPGVVLSTYEQFAHDRYSVTRIFPRFAGVERLRPIKQTVTFTAKAGSDEQKAMEDFIVFGTPFKGVDGIVTTAEGPAGTTQLGQGSFSFLTAKSNAFGFPPLEIRVIDSQGKTVCSIPAENVRHSSGFDTGGRWIAFSDAQGILDIDLQFGVTTHPASMTIRTTPTTGMRPANVLPTVQAVAQFVDGHFLVLAVRDGGPAVISKPWPLATDELQDTSKRFLPFLEALAEIQRHTFTRILVPDLEQVPPEQRGQILRAGRLLRGETVELDWNSFGFTVQQPENLGDLAAEKFALLTQETLIVNIADDAVETDMVVRTHVPAARVEGDIAPKEMSPGDNFRVIPAGKGVATMTAFKHVKDGDDAA